VPLAQLPDPDALTLTLAVSGAATHAISTAGMQRGVAQLLQDVSAFMTLSAGDILMLGVKAGTPRARIGDRFSIACAQIGTLHGHLVAETAQESA